MLTLRARWVLPIVVPPLRDGWIAIDRDRVAAVGPERRARARTGHQIDLGRAVVLPGLVNAHTHLELSYLRGAVPPAERFTAWIRDLMRRRRDQPEADAPVVTDAIAGAMHELRAAGTAVVGDISNTLASVSMLEQSPLAARVFFELVRFSAADAEETWSAAVARLAQLGAAPHVRVSVAPHAPYSVSPKLFQLIRHDLERAPFPRTSVHLCESREECELLLDGTGPWRALLEELNVWDPAWVPPGCGPVEYLDRMGMLGKEMLIVHGVHLSPGDLDRLAARGATLVTCPRSNRHVGVGDPPVARFYEAGVPVAVGTDSLASAPDLNVFNELAAMRRLAPQVPARRLLESATRIGALGLGFDEYGAIEPGSRAALIAVDIPPGVEDVEEYLVSGVAPDQVHWPLADLSEAASAI